MASCKPQKKNFGCPRLETLNSEGSNTHWGEILTVQKAWLKVLGFLSIKVYLHCLEVIHCSPSLCLAKVMSRGHSCRQKNKTWILSGPLILCDAFAGRVHRVNFPDSRWYTAVLDMTVLITQRNFCYCQAALSQHQGLFCFCF